MDKTLNFLIQKNSKKNDIMKEIKDSLFCEKIDQIFNINLKSKDKIFSLEKIYNTNNKFNLQIDDVSNNEKIIGFNSQDLNSKDNLL